MKLPHHYTTTIRLPFIVTDGSLHPGTDGLVWFTQNRGAGRISPPSREVAEREGVPVRLACPACLLMPWRKVARTVGWTAEQIGAENQRAIDQRDNPNEWLAATQPLGLTRLTIQILTADRGWWPVELRDLKAKRYVMFALPLTNVLLAGPVVRLYRRRKLAMTACRMRYMDGEERFFRLEDEVGQMASAL